MLRYRRGSETGGPGISSSKGRRHRSGRQQGQGQSHNFGRNSQDARSGYSQHGSDNGYGHNTNSSARTVHQAVPPSPASTKSAPNMRLIRRTIMIPMRVNLALSARVTDAPTGGTAPLARLPPALPGERAYVSQDVLVPRSSSAQRRPASTAAPKPRTLTMGTGNLPRRSDTAHLATATSSRALSLPTATEKRRASGSLPVAPTLEP